MKTTIRPILIIRNIRLPDLLKKYNQPGGTNNAIISNHAKLINLPAALSSFGIMQRTKCGDVCFKVLISLFNCSR